MPINVTCPSCLKRFTVSDKFAGKSGPCPSCQKTIQIPEKSEEVVIHAPEEAEPKDSGGTSILKPLRRKEVSIGTPVIVGSILAAIVVFFIALGLGLSGSQPHTAVLVVGALLLAPPLVFLGYWFLRDDELEGFDGRQLFMRCGICAAAFAALWALYAYVPRYVSGYSGMDEYTGLDMVIFIPLMIIVGTIIAIAVLELEFVQGIMHYMLYLGVTFVLAWAAGTHLASPLSSDSSKPGAANPGFSTPAVTQPDKDPDKPAAEPDKPQIPNMLQ